MLKHSFIHIPGVGRRTEKKLWKTGLSTWDDFTVCHGGVGKQLSNRMFCHLEQSRTALAKGQLGWFLEHLPASESWRVLNHSPATTAYLDIETTGLFRGVDHITTVALYDGRSLKTYVRGQNLRSLASDLRNYSLIVTYNGKCFDLPFIEDDLKFKITIPDVDLRYLCASLRWTGGLKQVESDLGLKRPRALSLLTGFDAPILWDKHCKGNPKALPTLLAYNCADVVSLRTIAQMVFNANLTSKQRNLRLAVDSPNYSSPHKPDLKLINQMKKEFFDDGF